MAISVNSNDVHISYLPLAHMFERGMQALRKDSIWDKLVFGKVQKLLGGRVKIVITGSAPLEAKVFNFIRAAFGCVVMEGYGQTEATAGITFSIAGDPSTGYTVFV
uniref:long-chain-fatty-acid--CoA ligase n=1 Tax=Magallana gigas TaxID=29159 RepID=K1PMX7_MAGGI